MAHQGRDVPRSFDAFEDEAVYVNGSIPRGSVITVALMEANAVSDYARRDLRIRRVYMRHVTGADAEEVFMGEYDDGWAEVSHRPLNVAQRAALIPMWKVEPKVNVA